MTTNRPTPPPAKTPKQTNWAAVSAVAAVAGVLIAFMAYAIPRGPSTPSPPPASTSTGSATYPTQQDQTSTSTAIVAPAGCQQGEAAITRYDDRAGTYNEQEAAGQALQDISLAEAAANGSGGPIFDDLQDLQEDFLYLQNYPPGNAQNDAARAQLGKDSQRLSTDCGNH